MFTLPLKLRVHRTMKPQEDTASLCESEPNRKRSRFSVESGKGNVKFSSKSLNGEEESSNLLYNEFYDDQPSEPFDVYAVYTSMHYALNRARKRTRLEKFQTYWANDSFYAFWRKKFLKEHSCNEQDIWQEVRLVDALCSSQVVILIVISSNNNLK